MHVRTCGKPLCGGGAPPPPATQQPSPATRRAGGSFSAHSVSHALPACLDGSAGAPHCASSSTTAPSVPPPATSTLPRRALGFQLLAAAAGALSAPQHALAATAEEIETLQAAAFAAYAERDFATAESALGQIIEAQPGDAKWLEMRAQAFVDGKDFDKAVKDFEQALVLMADGEILLVLHPNRWSPLLRLWVLQVAAGADRMQHWPTGRHAARCFNVFYTLSGARRCADAIRRLLPGNRTIEYLNTPTQSRYLLACAVQATSPLVPACMPAAPWHMKACRGGRTHWETTTRP